MSHALAAAQATAMAMLAGWLAERVVDTGLRIPGIGLFAGLVGSWVGATLWTWVGWDSGWSLGGFAVVPGVVGAFAVCGVLKLVGLGMAGPRW